jgi:hypothetical protein
MNHRSNVLVALSCAWLFACGGSPPAESPEPSSVSGTSESAPPATLESDVAFDGGGGDEREASPEPDKSEASTAAESSAPAEPSAEPADTKSSKSTRSAREIVTTTGSAFMIDYNGSAPKQAAEEKCDDEHEDDPQARAACMSKAREEFQADVLSFEKTKGGYFWVTYKRKGSALVEVHKVLVDFANETANSVTIKLKGAEQGKRAIFKRSREILVNVPNGYSIVLDDPDLGQLRYDAKIGLVGASANR